MSENLRQRAVQGSLYLTLRRMVSFTLAAIGMLYVTRVVGPSNYGLFAAVVGVHTYLMQIVVMGIRTYLIRASPDAPRELFHQAFWWLLGTSVVLALGAWGVVAALGHWWMREAGLATVAAAVFVMLPLFAGTVVSQAILERDLRYKRIAFIDSSAQAASYLVGVPMAQLGFGVWALVGAFWAAQLTTTIASFLSSRYRPRWYWEWRTLQEMLRYGLAQAASEWLYYSKNLAPALILLPLAGKEAVGYFALANRLMEMLNFVQTAIQRVTVPVLARVQDQPAKLLHALYLSSQAQILSLGVLCLGFVLSAWYVLPPLFGAQWDIRKAVLTLAILASEQLLTITFSAQAQALYVIRQPQVVTRAAAFFLVNLYASTALLTALFPAGWQVVGYGIAYYWAHLPNNIFLHRGISRYIGRPYYGVNLWWALALSVALFAPIAFYAPLLALGIFALPVSRRAVRALYAELRRARQPENGGSIRYGSTSDERDYQ